MLADLVCVQLMKQQKLSLIIFSMKKVQEEVKDKIVIVPRIYTNKPRTTGLGYKGMLHQPDPEKDSDIEISYSVDAESFAAGGTGDSLAG